MITINYFVSLKNYEIKYGYSPSHLYREHHEWKMRTYILQYILPIMIQKGNEVEILIKLTIEDHT